MVKAMKKAKCILNIISTTSYSDVIIYYILVKIQQFRCLEVEGQVQMIPTIISGIVIKDLVKNSSLHHYIID